MGNIQPPIYIHSPEMSSFYYGPLHPMKPIRLKYTKDYIEKAGVELRWIEHKSLMFGRRDYAFDENKNLKNINTTINLDINLKNNVNNINYNDDIINLENDKNFLKNFNARFKGIDYLFYDKDLYGSFSLFDCPNSYDPDSPKFYGVEDFTRIYSECSILAGLCYVNDFDSYNRKMNNIRSSNNIKNNNNIVNYNLSNSNNLSNLDFIYSVDGSIFKELKTNTCSDVKSNITKKLKTDLTDKIKYNEKFISNKILTEVMKKKIYFNKFYKRRFNKLTNNFGYNNNNISNYRNNYNNNLIDYSKYLIDEIGGSVEEWKNLENYKFKKNNSITNLNSNYITNNFDNNSINFNSNSNKNFLNKKIIFNYNGGLHHGRKTNFSGFCYLNDITMLITFLLNFYPKILYIDIDIHHGDGVESSFLKNDNVYTLSMHNFYKGFFPGTGSLISNYRACTNVPLLPGATDETVRNVFGRVVDRIFNKFNPSVVVLQCGADGLEGDRLGAWEVSIEGHCWMVEEVVSKGVGVIVLGGGGYSAVRVGRCWATEVCKVVGGFRLNFFGNTNNNNTNINNKSSNTNSNNRNNKSNKNKSSFNKFENCLNDNSSVKSVECGLKLENYRKKIKKNLNSKEYLDNVVSYVMEMIDKY